MRNYLQSMLMMLCLLQFTQEVLGQAVLRGKVIDEQNLSLPGENILLLGTTKGSITNQEGNFSLVGLPPGNYTLEVRYLGYISQTKEVV